MPYIKLIQVTSRNLTNTAGDRQHLSEGLFFILPWRVGWAVPALYHLVCMSELAPASELDPGTASCRDRGHSHGGTQLQWKLGYLCSKGRAAAFHCHPVSWVEKEEGEGNSLEPGAHDAHLMWCRISWHWL